MLNTSPGTQFSTLSSKIIRALLYFDIFSYPLTSQEVFKATNDKQCNLQLVEEDLRNLVKKGIIYQFGPYYSPQNKEEFVERREKGNQLAAEQMPIAHKMSKRIAQFPYVRAVLLSGSLSKDYMDEKGDIDYFVITQSGRLWIARTMIKLYRIIFLFNSDKHFCVNYFIDTEHLVIEEKNEFTGIELATTIPTVNPELYQKFREVNDWVDHYYPNYPPRSTEETQALPNTKRKRFLEWLFSGKLGEKLDGFFMQLTIKHWKRKFDHFKQEELDIAFKSRKYVSKQHSNHFQQKVLGMLEEKLKEFNF